MGRINKNEVFGTNPDQGVDFEILISGVMASSLVAISGASKILDYASIASALLILILTMIRRMALDNPFRKGERVMNYSIVAIFSIFAFAAIYFSIILTYSVRSQMDLNYFATLGTVLFTIPVLLIVSYEIGFRDFFLWLAIVSHNSAHDNDFGPFMVERAMLVSRLDHEEAPQEIAAEMTNPESNSLGLVPKIALIIAFVLFILLIAAAVGIVVIIVGEPIWLQLTILSFISIFLYIFLQFLFDRYGNAERDRFVKTKFRFLYFFIIAMTAYVGYS